MGALNLETEEKTMTLVLELKPETARRIEEQAAAQQVAPEEMAAQLLDEVTQQNGGKKHDALAEYLLDKNEELYRRLA